jgi:hypothetical protein
MLRLFLKYWMYIIPFAIGFMFGRFVVGFVGPAVEALGDFSWMVTLGWPVMFGIFAVTYLTPRLKRFFRE